MRALERCRRVDRVLCKYFLEILADDRRLDDDGAVVHERRHDGLGIQRQVLRLELLAAQNVDVT
jgi:hypothetical protein